jgi:glycosyltransferase involved in cell wall biosynthesis
MRNVHIYPSAFTHESRILKEAKTLRAHLGFTEIMLVGVRAKGLLPSERVDDATTIFRLGPGKGAGRLAKLVMHLFWCIHVFFFVLRQRPACVNCHSLPVLPIGVAIKLLTGAKLVYDAHELETETSGLSGVRKTASKLVERLFIRIPDLVVLVGPGIERWYRESYGISNTVVILNVPRYSRAARGAVLRERLSIPSGVVILLYQGNISAGRGVEEHADAAVALDPKKYAVFFMGFGPLADRIKDASIRHSAIYYQPAVPPSEILKYSSSANIGIVPFADTCLNHRLSLPNKLFEYVMAGLPVIASRLPEMEQFVTSRGIGRCISVWNAEHLISALQEIENMYGSGLDARIEEVACQYCWEREEEKLATAYEKYLGLQWTTPPAGRRVVHSGANLDNSL